MSGRIIALLLVVGAMFGLLVATVVDAWSPAKQAFFFFYSMLAGTYLAALLLGCISALGEELRKRGVSAEERREGTAA